MNPRNDIPFIDTEQRDRRINSEEKLIHYVRTMLGEPLIKVDVTDEQIKYAIDNAFRKFSEYAVDGQDHWVILLNVQENVQNYILDERVKAIREISIARGLSNIQSSNGGIYLGALGTIPIGYIPYVYPTGETSHLERTGNLGNFSTVGVAGSVDGKSNALGSIESAYAYMTNSAALRDLFGQTIEYHYNSGKHILRIFSKISGTIAIDAEIEYIPDPKYDDNYGHVWIKDYVVALVKKMWGNNVGKYSGTLVGGSSINYDRLISEAESEIKMDRTSRNFF